MTKAPSLVIMAAGMGSRYGGLKQITPVGPHGEKLMEYSIYDALSAGFGEVVFVIKHEIDRAFREQIGDELAKHVPVKYVYQELCNLPAGFSVPPGRVKPWGTGHAVLCCREALDGPFAVINADDYYGQESYYLLRDFLAREPDKTCLHMAMAGYLLKNTLTENGYVSRGVCSVDADGYLTHVVERAHIEQRDGRAMFTEDDGATWEPLPLDCLVSMNCWAFPEGTLQHFERLFSRFLSSPDFRPEKSEFYLPFAVSSLIEEGQADVRVLHTPDKWYGMTYPKDREAVAKALARMVDEGKYPSPLWG